MDLVANIVNDSIKVETKELEPCLQQVDITIPAEKVESGYNRIAKQFAKEAKLSGFRAGKAPVHVIKNLYKKKIEEELKKKQELFSLRLKALEKQESELTKQVEDLRTEIMKKVK